MWKFHCYGLCMIMSAKHVLQVYRGFTVLVSCPEVCVCVSVSVMQEDGKKSFGFNLRRSGHLNKAKEIMD